MLHDNKCVGECSFRGHVVTFFDTMPVFRVCVCLTVHVCPLDIDECGTELARCPSNTYCHNTDGSYECRGMPPCVTAV